MWWWENGSVAKLEENGIVIASSNITMNSPQPQNGLFSLDNKQNGNYSYRVLLCDGLNCTPSDVKKIIVTLPSVTNPVNTGTNPASTTGPVTAPSFHFSDEMKRMIYTATPLPTIPQVDLNNPLNNTTNVARVMRIFPETKWNEIFPVRKAIYTYEEFLKATAKFPKFCDDVAPGNNMDLDTACKTELATIFAHFIQETGAHSPGGFLPDNPNTVVEEWRQWLYAIRENGCTNDSPWCEQYRGKTCAIGSYYGTVWPCPVGAKYFGRWAHQISYNYNYGEFSIVAFWDAQVLLTDPDRVAREGWLALSSAIWFYMTPHSPKPSMHDVVVGYWQPNAADMNSGNYVGFGVTTNIINGWIECGKWTETTGAKSRISYFEALTKAIWGQLGTHLGCATSQTFSANGTAVVPSYFEQTWDGSQSCQIVAWQTGFSVFLPDSYKRCVKHYYGITPANNPEFGVVTPPVLPTTIYPPSSIMVIKVLMKKMSNVLWKIFKDYSSPLSGF